METISDWVEIISDWDADDFEQALWYRSLIFFGLLGAEIVRNSQERSKDDRYRRCRSRDTPGHHHSKSLSLDEKIRDR